MNWKQYQEEVAKIFKSLGAKTFIEYTISGARGKHKVDVLVRFKIFGVGVIWICECKYWNTPIPKEKVLTLYEITKDVGADKGFLFSESGFQSGAIMSSKKTNVILTSLGEISELIKQELVESSLIRVLKEIDQIKSNLKTGWIDDLKNPVPLKNIEFDRLVLIDGTLMYLSLEIQKAINNNYPIVISWLESASIKCYNVDELLKILNEYMPNIRSISKDLLKIIKKDQKKIQLLKDSFLTAAQYLIIATENQLYCKEEEVEDLSHNTLKYLKLVGKYADGLHELARGTLKKELEPMMQKMITEIYPYMTERNIDISLWRKRKENATYQLEVFGSIEKY